MPAIPDRWIPYKACGNVIEGTRFICFKVPLKKSVQTGVRDIKEIWDIPALLNKIPNLGAVVDLTNTARYYNPEEFKAAGILHRKILMPGRIIPPENKVTEFMDVIDEWLGNDAESLIGIHCTHGLNRTGYMVCRYMRDRLGVPAKDAIKRFEKARGYQIERDNYIADLLGKPLPAPDVGKNTNIKPIGTQYIRSPLMNENEDEVDASRSRERFNRNRRCRCNNTCNKYSECDSRSCYSNNRRNDGKDGERSNNWRDRESNHSNRTNKQSYSRNNRSREGRDRSRSGSESSRSSYDFRYDY